MKKQFKILTVLFIIISLVTMFSACADDTAITVYGDDTSHATESIEPLPDTNEIQTAVNTDVKDETEIETKKETEIVTTTETEPQTEAVTEHATEEITKAVTEPPETEQVKEQVTEMIPDQTTSSPETEKESEAEITEKTENKIGTEYLLNTNSKKFHYLSCKSGQKTKDVNRAYHTGTREEVIAKGYIPCKVCNP